MPPRDIFSDIKSKELIRLSIDLIEFETKEEKLKTQQACDDKIKVRNSKFFSELFDLNLTQVAKEVIVRFFAETATIGNLDCCIAAEKQCIPCPTTNENYQLVNYVIPRGKTLVFATFKDKRNENTLTLIWFIIKETKNE